MKRSRHARARRGATRPRKARADLANAALYQRVARSLQDDIVSGHFPVGAKLPGENELCRRFSVSRHTIRQALRQLRDEGLVASRQGAGTIVLKPAQESRYVQNVASIEALIQYAAEYRYDVDATEVVSCDTQLARKLGCARGDKWLRVTGFRFPPKQSVPICWTEVYLRPRFKSVIRSLRRGAIYAQIEQAYGLRFTEVQQTLRVREVPSEIARELGVEVGSPVVEVCRVYRLATGTVAEIAFNLHPADRFAYSMTLQRNPS